MAGVKVRCPDCWDGHPIPCAVGCQETDECCDKSLDYPCDRCEGTGWLESDSIERRTVGDFHANG